MTEVARRWVLPPSLAPCPNDEDPAYVGQDTTRGLDGEPDLQERFSPSTGASSTGAGDHRFFFAVCTIGLSKLGGRKPSTLLGAMRHNRRTIAEHLAWRSCLDPSRRHMNKVLAGEGSPEEVVARAVRQCVDAGIDIARQRKDYVQAIELLFSLPAETKLDTHAYFQKCLEWAHGRFGGVVLAADVHYDEAAPHCHIIILPLVEGRLVGSDLVTRGRVAAMWASFAQEVAQPYGISTPPRRMSPGTRAGTASAVRDRVAASIPGLVQSPIWALVRRAIERDPGAYASALGLDTSEQEVAKPRMRTMAEIFTGKGKGVAHVA